MIYGYARVSTTDQDLAIQHATLTAAGYTETRDEFQEGVVLANFGEVDLSSLQG